jgi:hypothetical protein
MVGGRVAPSGRLLSFLLIFCLVVPPPAAAASALAIITFAANAQLGEARLSAGTIVYPGDRVSTEANGELGMRSKKFRAQFGSHSTLMLQDSASEPGGETVIEMYAGRMELSTIEAAPVAIRVNGASLRPTRNAALATMEVRGPREVHIYLRRGTYELEYQGESALLEEAKSYAILLDPTPKEMALAETLDTNAKPKKPANKRTFLLILIAAAAAGAAVPELRHHPESPHNPGHGRH